MEQCHSPYHQLRSKGGKRRRCPTVPFEGTPQRPKVLLQAPPLKGPPPPNSACWGTSPGTPGLCGAFLIQMTAPHPALLGTGGSLACSTAAILGLLWWLFWHLSFCLHVGLLVPGSVCVSWRFWASTAGTVGNPQDVSGFE